MTARPKSRIVRCCHCMGMMKVSARALSVFCPHCQKHAPLESLRIIGSHPGKTLATCGDIFIEATARLNLAVIANNIVIRGRVRGPVVANETVEVGPTGQVIGDIKAAKIIVCEGAIIEGRCEMTPPVPPELEPSLEPTLNDGTATTEDRRAAEETANITALHPSPAANARPLPPPPGKIKSLGFA